MKSNQEQRSNECLPPKKRELASNAAAPADDQPRPLATPPGDGAQRGENLAWFASVVSGRDGGGGAGQHRVSESDGPQYKPLVSSLTDSAFSSRAAISSLSAIYTSPLSHHAVVGGAGGGGGGGVGGGGGGGTIHYTQLPPSLQFVPSPYVPAGPAPYAGYISSQLLPPPPPPPPRSEAPHYPSPASLASKMDQYRAPSGRPAPPPPPPTAAQHYVQAPRTAPSSLPPPHHAHHHHALALAGGGAGGPQVLVQYSDGPPRKDDAPLHPPRPREPPLNGELDRGGRRFESGKPGSKGGSISSSSSSSSSSHFHQQQSPHHYEARHVVLPVDYNAQDHPALRTSLMLVPNSHHGDHAHPHPHPHHHQRPAGSSPAPSPHSEKGKAVSRPPPSSSSSSSTFVFPPPLSVDSLKAAVAALPPHTVIQTPHSATETLSLGLPSAAGFYPQPPVIGYIAGGGGGQQQPISYHHGLPQHLLIPGAQSVIIPVSGGGVTGLDAAHVTSSHAYVTSSHAYVTASPAPKGERFDPPAPPTFAHPSGTGAVVQAQLHLPVVVPAPPDLLAPPPAAAAPPSLPPYFVKGSIIQLADGELKRVEDLKTEDFIQSAEISSELKIDSSTVERIDGSHAPNFAVVQFSVGEHRAQVSVEVLAEYPFFVFGQGWSSCCPDRTTALLELPCARLAVGDVCISLTLRNLKNGSLRSTPSLELHARASSPGHAPFLKPPKAAAGAPRGGGGSGSARHGEQENGIGQHGPPPSGGGTNSENGEARGGGGEAGAAAWTGSAGGGARPGRRKRRWSAPEGRKVERTEEEPPLTLPKPSFLPQDLKTSIEGRSNLGK